MEKQPKENQTEAVNDPTPPTQRCVYLMVRDIDVDGEQEGVEWGVDWGLAEGETLPADVEDLTNAQYAVWRFIKVLQGLGNDEAKAELKQQVAEKPSGIIVPRAGKIVPS